MDDPVKPYDLLKDGKPSAPQSSVVAQMQDIAAKAPEILHQGLRGMANGVTRVQNGAITAAGGDPSQYNEDLLLGTAYFGGTGYYAYRTFTKNAISIFDPRTQMANQILARGHASIDEILQSSYGEWPPKGLEIVRTNDQRVKLVPILDLAGHESGNFFSRATAQINDLTSVAGRATLAGERVLAINRGFTTYMPGLFGQSSLHSTMGHEAVHNLQGDHYWRAADVFGRETAMSLWRSQNDAASNMIVKETFDQHTTRSQLTGRDLYLRAGIEIQARIHEVLLDGYQRWGTLPQNREQLIVAMADMGMKPPASVMQSLEQSPTIAETRQVFGGNSSATPPASRDISRAIGTLTETGRTEFWNRSMPALYSDLIEMYGDGPGRARFGLGDNPWPQHRAQAEKLSDSFGKAAEPSSSVPTAPKTAKASPPSPQQATPVAEKAESTPGHSKISLKGGVTGAALAIGVGIAAAAQPGATQRSVTDSMVDSALPGWMSARKGESCKAFGEVAGAVASGAAALAASVPIIGAAVTVTAVSGPAAPVVGTAAAIGATAAVAGVAVATNEAVAPAVETACKLSVSTYQTVKNKLGF